MCHRRLAEDEPATCRTCVRTTRACLSDLADLYALLPVELAGRAGSASSGDTRHGSDRPLPAGDLLALIGGGSDGGARDAQPDDPPSVPWTLGSWEDDWRRLFGHGPSGPCTVATAAAYLSEHAHLAGNRHPAFAEFAREVRALRRRVMVALRLHDDPVVLPADCMDCGGTLVRDYAPPRPLPAGVTPGPGTDQGGLRDTVRCVGCGRVRDHAEYMLAVRHMLEAAANW